MALELIVSELAGRVLANEGFDALLPEMLDALGRHFDVPFAACCIEQGARRREFGWDRRSGDARTLGAWPWARAQGPGVVEAQPIPADDLGLLQQRGLSSGLIASVGLESGGAFHVLVGGEQPLDAHAQSLGALAALLAMGASRQSFKDDALFDPLTDLYNRRYMDLALPGEVDRAKRYRAALTLLILDVDRFKEINDAYGHVTGDRVLSQLSRTLEESIRASDVPVRYGGDEFVLILPATPLGGVQTLVERLQSRLRDVHIGPIKGLHVSGGVAAAREDLGPQDLLLEADDLLYRAKKSGRNQIQFPPPGTQEFPAPVSHYAGA